MDETEGKSSPETPAQEKAPTSRQEKGPSEVEEFFGFLKQYYGLLAALASVPLITGALGVLEPPRGYKQLSLLASVFSVVTFGAAFILRGILAGLIRKPWWRAIPPLLVIAAMAASGWLTAYYLGMHERHEPPSIAAQDKAGNAQREIELYLSIYPILTFAIGLLGTAAFVMSPANTIQRVITENLSEKQDDLKRDIESLSSFYFLAAKSPFLRVGEKVLDLHKKRLEGLGKGQIEVSGDTARLVQETMLRTYTHSFDAVSDRDALFWGDQREPFAAIYLDLTADAVKSSVQVTRLFLFSDEELTDVPNISKLLERQKRMGIAWGVVPYEALDPMLRSLSAECLDFALFNFNQAASFFPERGVFRHLKVIFNVDLSENRNSIMEQATRFLEILCQCWFINPEMEAQIERLGAWLKPLGRFAKTKPRRHDRDWLIRLDPASQLKYITLMSAINEGTRHMDEQNPRLKELKDVKGRLEPQESHTKDGPPQRTCQFRDCVLLGAAASRSEIEQMVNKVNSLRNLAKLGEDKKTVEPPNS